MGVGGENMERSVGMVRKARLAWIPGGGRVCRFGSIRGSGPTAGLSPSSQARHGTRRPGQWLRRRDQPGQRHGAPGSSRLPPLPLVSLQQAGAQPLPPVGSIQPRDRNGAGKPRLHSYPVLPPHAWPGHSVSLLITPIPSALTLAPHRWVSAPPNSA